MIPTRAVEKSEVSFCRNEGVQDNTGPSGAKAKHLTFPKTFSGSSDRKDLWQKVRGSGTGPTP